MHMLEEALASVLASLLRTPILLVVSGRCVDGLWKVRSGCTTCYDFGQYPLDYIADAGEICCESELANRC